MKDEKHFSLDELSSLTGIPKRTIRFYMQMELVPKPEGANRGAYYLPSHLDRLLEIQKWQKAGISLQRIGELLRAPQGQGIPERMPAQGDVAVKSHVYLHPGVELVIDPREAGLSPEDMAGLTRSILDAINKNMKGGNDEPVQR
ncbi:MAG: MerR family transcriptional regulator [Mailhella sp.]|nr:MerR family transcriptional regulator [Mailhella sp.]